MKSPPRAGVDGRAAPPPGRPRLHGAAGGGGWRARGWYLLGVVWGAATIALVALASAEAACRWSARAGLAVAVGVSLAVAVQSFRLHTPSLFFAAMLGLAAGVIGALSAGDAREALAGCALEDATARDAHEHPDTTRFRFRDARVLTDGRSTLRIFSTNPRRPGMTIRHVAPIVDADWASGDPVRAWAVSHDDPAHLKGWGEPLNAAVRSSSMAPEADYRSAIEQSGIPTYPDAALLVWVADPEATVADWRREHRAVLPVFGGIWLVTMLAIVPGVRRFAGRRAGHEDSGSAAMHENRKEHES
jgi:hypothetical protein